MTLLAALVLSVSLAEPLSAEADPDRDGIHAHFDACPHHAEDADEHEDADGCPEPTRVVFQFNDPDGNAVIPEVRVGDSGPLPGRRRLHVPLDNGTYWLTAGLKGFLPLREKVVVDGGPVATVTFVMQPAREVPLVDCLMVGRAGTCRYGALRQGLP